MATCYFRSGAWHFRVRRAKLLPNPIHFSFEDRAEGEAYAKRLEALLDRGIVPAEFAQKKQGDLRFNLMRYQREVALTIDDDKLLNNLIERLPRTLRLVDVTFSWATDWVAGMKRELNLSPSTIRHYVGALSRALNWLVAHGDMKANPLASLPKGYASYGAEDVRVVKKRGGEAKADEERDRRLQEGEEPEIRRLLAGGKPKSRQRALALNHADALALLFDMALETAMRMREMYTLDWKQVKLKERTIFLDKTKNGDKRQVPMSSVMVKLLESYKGDYDGRLFPWWSGVHDPDELKRVTSLLSRQYDRLFNAAGAEDLHFHDLRHEATSRLFERTDLRDTEIMKITGHKDPRMLKRYANLRGSVLAAKLW